MMIVSLTANAGMCDRMDNFIMLGKLADDCMTEVKKSGKSAMTSYKSCIVTEKYHMQYGLATLSTMNQNIAMQCMMKDFNGYNTAESGILRWTQYRYGK